MNGTESLPAGSERQETNAGELRRAAIWWNEGQAKFSEDTQRLRTSQRHGQVVGDFDGDGSLYIFAPEYDNNYRLWLNQGDGVFRGANWP